jgi:hypothetical protein
MRLSGDVGGWKPSNNQDVAGQAMPPHPNSHQKKPTCVHESRRFANRLAGDAPHLHPPGMFVISEEEAAAIRAAFHQGGELAAAVELRRRFPGITDTVKARECARSIAGWGPLSLPLRPPARLRCRRKD